MSPWMRSREPSGRGLEHQPRVSNQLLAFLDRVGVLSAMKEGVDESGVIAQVRSDPKVALNWMVRGQVGNRMPACGSLR